MSLFEKVKCQQQDCGPYVSNPNDCSACCPIPLNCNDPCPTCTTKYISPITISCRHRSIYNTPYIIKNNKNPQGRLLPTQRVQGGRWNQTLTNTKLFPVISICRDESGAVLYTKQSETIYNNSYKMSQKELISYLSRNRKFLNR